MSENSRYLSNSEMVQFKIDCPACVIMISLQKFSEHLKKDIEEIREKHRYGV